VDVLVAVLVALIQIAGTITYSMDEPGRWEFDGFAAVLLGIGPLALLFRRGWPDATLAVAFAAAAAYAATGYPRGPAGMPAFALALASAIVSGRRAFAWGLLAVAIPAFVVLPSVLPDEVERTRSLASRGVGLVWLPLVGAAGEIVRIRRERRAEREHAEREQARRRASEERLLIARELHDVLAHTISLISVQSGVALHLLDVRPEYARSALEAINHASDEALAELRSVLDVLSRGLDADTGGDGWTPRTPTAGLADLEGLVRRTCAAGLDVSLHIAGPAQPLPAEVDLAVYRIVQEALTNVVRHAGGGARATVRLAYAPHEVHVRVDDDGPSHGPGAAVADGAPGGGRGIAGMRERARALGATVEAGPGPDGGFHVLARFPLRDGQP
jgi:signal transduction histidine kinase